MKNLLPAIVIILITTVSGYSQQQVVAMRKDHILKRFVVGDLIRYSTSGKKNFKRERIVELTDTTIITNIDTVAYYKIKLLDVHVDGEPGITVRKIGAYAMVAGVLLPLADIINVTLVQDKTYEFDDGVAITSATLITAGLLMYILDKPYIKLGFPNTLRVINSDSPLYKSGLPVKRFMDYPEN